MGYRLKVISGPGQGSELELDDGESTIGRAPENALVINDNNVSRVHARVRVAGGGRISVEDAGSRNGVYVNDRKLDGDEASPITPGDRVVIGQSILEVIGNGAAARPRTGTAQKSAMPVPVARNGAVAPVAPRATGAMPAARAPTGQVARGPAPGARPAPAPTGPKVVAKKEKASFLTPPMLAAIGAVVLVGLLFIVGSGGGKKDTARADASAKPRVTPPPPPLPAGYQVDDPNDDKCSKECQIRLDQGDSARDSGNLKAARDLFRAAVKIEPTCLSCAVRLEAVERAIEEKIRKYEKSGLLSFESGDYVRAVDQWKIAVEYMGDSKSPRARDMMKKIQDAESKIERQPQ